MNVLFETGESGATATTHDWLTPPEILNALGEFDLDPCASEFQPWRTAKQQFTIKDDGMAREWQGRVWCNPPYGPFAARWLERCAAHGNAVALVFARTETAVFQDHLLFLRGRLSFRLPGGGACWKRRRSVRPDRIRHDQCRHPRRLRAGWRVRAPWWGCSMTEVVKRVLDPCCGSRMFWFDHQHPDVVFGDARHETLTVTDRSHGNADGVRTLRIEPDVMLDFRALPYPDGAFKLVSFDPPHLVRAGPKSWLAAKYGKLGPDWREDLRAGFAECFRVLDTDGVLIFKWNETQVKVGDILALTDVSPLFGHPTGRKGLTHWIVFMKPISRSQECSGGA